MPDGPFQVVNWSIEELVSLFAKFSGTTLQVEKDQIDYFDEYFEESCCLTIVVEHPYVDHDYLDDYAAYYAKCFHPYDRFCARLHFFTCTFTEDDFVSILRGVTTDSALSAAELNSSYLGFVVVKPLPGSFIGRTCLRTYPSENRRFYPTTRNYESHLFGISLSVEAVPFQEQDSTVAMCATSALWSALHGTGKLFQHSLLSPVEITKAATLNSDDPMRFLPNVGLTDEQIARAIRSVSLEPYFVAVHNSYVLRSTVYAYLKGHIPLLLDIDLVDVNATEERNATSGAIRAPASAVNDQGDGRFTISGNAMGSHEVAVVGYCLGGQPEPLQESGFLLTATRVDKLYAHDDQIGPYARMAVDSRGFLSTSWRGDTSMQQGTVWAIPGNLLVPLYNKIRIPFEKVHDAVLPLDSVLEELRSDGAIPLSERLEWDIFLIASNDLKDEILHAAEIKGKYKQSILSRPMPRFLWRALARCGTEKVVDLLFDATDIDKGRLFLFAIEYNTQLSAAMRELGADNEVRHELLGTTADVILQSFQ
jgi:hypothetical protein